MTTESLQSYWRISSSSSETTATATSTATTTTTATTKSSSSSSSNYFHGIMRGRRTAAVSATSTAVPLSSVSSTSSSLQSFPSDGNGSSLNRSNNLNNINTNTLTNNTKAMTTMSFMTPPPLSSTSTTTSSLSLSSTSSTCCYDNHKKQQQQYQLNVHPFNDSTSVSIGTASTTTRCNRRKKVTFSTNICHPIIMMTKNINNHHHHRRSKSKCKHWNNNKSHRISNNVLIVAVLLVSIALIVVTFKIATVIFISDDSPSSSSSLSSKLVQYVSKIVIQPWNYYFSNPYHSNNHNIQHYQQHEQPIKNTFTKARSDITTSNSKTTIQGNINRTAKDVHVTFCKSTSAATIATIAQVQAEIARRRMIQQDSLLQSGEEGELDNASSIKMYTFSSEFDGSANNDTRTKTTNPDHVEKSEVENGEEEEEDEDENKDENDDDASNDSSLMFTLDDYCSRPHITIANYIDSEIALEAIKKQQQPKASGGGSSTFTSIFSSGEAAVEEEQQGQQQEEQQLPILIVGGTDGSGTRAFVDILRQQLGAWMLIEDKQTMDIHASTLFRRQGWPALANYVFNVTHSGNYKFTSLPAEHQQKIRSELSRFYQVYTNKYMRDLRYISSVQRDPTEWDGTDKDGVITSAYPNTAKGVLYGFKAPISMVLLPLLREVYGSIKFVHIVRDGRDVSLSSNMSPVAKFYDTYYGIEEATKRRQYAQNTISKKSSGTNNVNNIAASAINNNNTTIAAQVKIDHQSILAMDLWNDWNIQVHEYCKETADGGKTFDYIVLRAEDLMSSPQTKYATIMKLAHFVGTPRITNTGICKFSTDESSVRDMGNSDTMFKNGAAGTAGGQGGRGERAFVTNHFIPRNPRHPYPSSRFYDEDRLDYVRSKYSHDSHGRHRRLEQHKSDGTHSSDGIDGGGSGSVRGNLRMSLEEQRDFMKRAKNPRIGYPFRGRRNKIGSDVPLKNRYGKWMNALANEPELSKVLHEHGSEALRIFGYEPYRAIDSDIYHSDTSIVCPPSTVQSMLSTSSESLSS